MIEFLVNLLQRSFPQFAFVMLSVIVIIFGGIIFLLVK